MISTGREILTLTREKRTIETKIETLTKECKKAEQDFTDYETVETKKLVKIQKDLDTLKKKVPLPPKPTDMPMTPQEQELEDSLNLFMTFWEYPLESRRQSFIDMLRGQAGLPPRPTTR